MCMQQFFHKSNETYCFNSIEYILQQLISLCTKSSEKKLLPATTGTISQIFPSFFNMIYNYQIRIKYLVRSTIWQRIYFD